MKTELDLSERFSLLSILPVVGNIATLKLIRKLREDLSLTEEEMVEYEVKQVGDQILWNATKENGFKEFEFGEFVESLIKGQLVKLDQESNLEDRHVTVFEKFVEGNLEVKEKH